MSRKLIIPIPDFTHTEKTYLDADYSSGTALTVVNNYGYTLNDIAILGQPGEEKTESKPVTSQTGNTIINVTGAFKFSHNKNTILYRYEYDQYQIYRYRAAVWTLISTSNIQWDKRETIYIDANGLATDSYRYALYNSASTSSSDYSPTIAATGFTNRQVGYMIDNVRKIAGDTERLIIKSDDELIRQFERAQIIIKSVKENWWFLRKESDDITSLANTRTYGFVTYLSDLIHIDTVRYRYVNGSESTTYPLKYKTLSEMDQYITDNNQDSSDHPTFYTIEPADSVDSVGYISVDKPILTAGAGTFFIRYFKDMTPLTTVASETDVPIPSILEDYALAYIFHIKGDETRAKMYEERFYGPQPSKAEKMYNREPTGIRLLELLQKSKGRPIGEPLSLKKPRRTSSRDGLDRDYIAENYF